MGNQDNVVPLHGQHGQPTGGEAPVPVPAPAPATQEITVTVSFGPTTQEFQFTQGEKVGKILGNGYIKEIIGFKGKETLLVNGRPATADHLLNNGDTVEFIK